MLDIKSAPPYHPNTYSAPAASADFSSTAPVWRGPWDSRCRRRFHGYKSRTGIYQGLRLDILLDNIFWGLTDEKESKGYERQMSLEVTQLLIGALYNMGIRYNQMTKIFDCSDNTITNGRKNKATPDEHSMKASLERLPRFLENTGMDEEWLVKHFLDYYKARG